MKPYQPDWLKNEILDGLSKLLTLSLERQPAFDMIEGTALAWLEAVTYQREWSQCDDQLRVVQAFRWLAANSTTWPNPKQFLDAMPRRISTSDAKQLGNDNPTPEEIEARETSRKRVRAIIDETARKLRIEL